MTQANAVFTAEEISKALDDPDVELLEEILPFFDADEISEGIGRHIWSLTLEDPRMTFTAGMTAALLIKGERDARTDGEQEA